MRNNVEITRKEQIRVFDRIARSRAFSSMEEAFSTVLDNSEGAGLGIVILILMLKKIGLDEDAFDIEVENGETVATLAIPLHRGADLEKWSSSPSDRPGGREPAPVPGQHRLPAEADRGSQLRDQRHRPADLHGPRPSPRIC